MKNLGLWSPGYEILFEKFVKPPGSLSYILNVPSLIVLLFFSNRSFLFQSAIFAKPINICKLFENVLPCHKVLQRFMQSQHMTDHFIIFYL